MIGYGGRILMYQDPWDFNGFILQIVCITIAPVFLTAAIYLQLYKSVFKLSPSSALFKPALYYQIFIPCDVVSLVLQAAGGAMSAQSGDGDSKTLKYGVDIGLAGLSFQVICLFAFIVLCAHFAWSYWRDIKAGKASAASLDGRFKIFLAFLTLSTITIFIRCAYRIYELSDGYGGEAIHDQPTFIGLESVMIIIAIFSLNIGHPGLVFDPRRSNAASSAKSGQEAEKDDVMA
ncbi:parasitic phase-specific protein psp-1 [Elasticomyces elasticus]|nr:parasitic phase-specific protein psp-1 [Elasticomyces elasticus]